MVGQTISHYQILEKLGTGGMGEIYKGRDTRLNRFVAIKVLAGSMSGNPALRQRFIQEAQSASALNHPNIITIFDVVSENDSEYMVMELVAGDTLVDLIPRGGLRVPQVLNYGVQMADALAAAHAAGIVHRDLKPGNVMVTHTGLVKVLDFGLAKVGAAGVGPVSEDAETVANAPLTVEGSILGTVSYMSPEQAEGRRVDARSDIFSFGILLYEMVAGVRPFSGESAVSTLSAVLRDEARPLTEISPDVPARLQEIIFRCLRKDPDARPQSMKEVHAELQSLKQQSDSGALYHQELPPPVPPKRTSFAVPLVLALIVAAAAGGAWWFMHRGSAAPAPVTLPPAPAVTTPERSERPERPEQAEKTERPEGKPPTPPAKAPAPPPAPAAPSVSIHDGTALIISLTADIPADAAAGTQIRFTLAKDLDVDGHVVARTGATATGEIVQENKKKFLGIGGKMMFRLLTLETGGAQSLKIRATPARRANTEPIRPVDASGRAHPKGVVAVAGTQYVAYIDGDQTLTQGK